MRLTVLYSVFLFNSSWSDHLLLYCVYLVYAWEAVFNRILIIIFIIQFCVHFKLAHILKHELKERVYSDQDQKYQRSSWKPAY